MAFQPLSLTEPGVSSPTFIGCAAGTGAGWAEDAEAGAGACCCWQAVRSRTTRPNVRFMLSVYPEHNAAEPQPNDESNTSPQRHRGHGERQFFEESSVGWKDRFSPRSQCLSGSRLSCVQAPKSSRNVQNAWNFAPIPRCARDKLTAQQGGASPWTTSNTTTARPTTTMSSSSR